MSKAKASSKAKDWHRQDIMSEIRKRGSTLAELGRQNGCKPATAYNVFHRPYPKMERIIAEFLNVEPQVIWPTRYAKPNTENSEFIGTDARVA